MIKINYRLWLITFFANSLTLLLILVPHTYAGPSSVIEKIENIRYNNNRYVIIYLSKEADYNVNHLSGNLSNNLPPRIYLDFKSTIFGPGVPSFMKVDDGLIRDIRTGYYKHSIPRVVMDLELDKMGGYHSCYIKSPYRILILIWDKEISDDEIELTDFIKTKTQYKVECDLPYKVVSSIKDKSPLTEKEYSEYKPDHKDDNREPVTKSEQRSEESESTSESSEFNTPESEEFKKEKEVILRELDPAQGQGQLVETPIGPKGYRIQLGIFTKFNSDIFQALAGSPTERAFRIVPSIKAEVDFLKKKESQYTGKVRVGYNIFLDIDNANYPELDAALEYEFGKNGIEFEYSINLEELAFVEDDELIRSTDHSWKIKYARFLSPPTRARIIYKLSYEDFPKAKERNNIENGIRGDIRYKVNKLFVPGIGFEIERRDANTSNQDRDEWAPFFLLDSRISDNIYSSFRYRYRRQNYTSDNEEDSNFNRVDNENAFTENLNIKLSKKWWLDLFTGFEKNNSTRSGRDFNSYQFGTGLFYRFP